MHDVALQILDIDWVIIGADVDPIHVSDCVRKSIRYSLLAHGPRQALDTVLALQASEEVIKYIRTPTGEQIGLEELRLIADREEKA